MHGLVTLQVVPSCCVPVPSSTLRVTKLFTKDQRVLTEPWNHTTGRYFLSMIPVQAIHFSPVNFLHSAILFGEMADKTRLSKNEHFLICPDDTVKPFIAEIYLEIAGR